MIFLRGLAIHHKRSPKVRTAKADRLSAVSSIRMTDAHFAKRIANKYGWSIGAPTDRQSLVHRLQSTLAKSESHHVELAFYLQQVSPIMRTAVFANEWIKLVSQQVVQQLRSTLAPVIVHKVSGRDSEGSIAASLIRHRDRETMTGLVPTVRLAHEGHSSRLEQFVSMHERDQVIRSRSMIVDKLSLQQWTDRRTASAPPAGQILQRIVTRPGMGMTNMIVQQSGVQTDQGALRMSDFKRIDTSVHRFARMILAEAATAQAPSPSAMETTRAIQHVNRLSPLWLMAMQAQAFAITHRQQAAARIELTRPATWPWTVANEQTQLSWLSSSTTRLVHSTVLQRLYALTQLAAPRDGQRRSEARMAEQRSVHLRPHPLPIATAEETRRDVPRLALHVREERVLQARMLHTVLQQLGQSVMPALNRTLEAGSSAWHTASSTQQLTERTRLPAVSQVPQHSIHRANNLTVSRSIQSRAVIRQWLQQVQAYPVELMNVVRTYVRAISSVLFVQDRQLQLNILSDARRALRWQERSHALNHTATLVQTHRAVQDERSTLSNGAMLTVNRKQRLASTLAKPSLHASVATRRQDIGQRNVHLARYIHEQHGMSLAATRHDRPQQQVNRSVHEQMATQASLHRQQSQSADPVQAVRQRSVWSQRDERPIIVRRPLATPVISVAAAAPASSATPASRMVATSRTPVTPATSVTSRMPVSSTTTDTPLSARTGTERLPLRPMQSVRNSLSKLSTLYQSQIEILQQASEQSTIAAVLKHVIHHRSIRQVRTTLDKTVHYLRVSERVNRRHQTVRTTVSLGESIIANRAFAREASSDQAIDSALYNVRSNRLREQAVDGYSESMIARQERRIRERESSVSLEHIEQIKPHRTASRITVSRKQTPLRTPRLDVVTQQQSLKRQMPTEVLESMQSAIQTLQKDLTETKHLINKPEHNLNRLTDQLYKEFTRRLRFEQQRRGR